MSAATAARRGSDPDVPPVPWEGPAFGFAVPVLDLRFVLLSLRKLSELCARLDAGPWAVFVVLLAHIGARGVACVSQATLALETGYSERSIRLFVGLLVRLGLLLVRRERLPNGHERLHYALGEVGALELERLAKYGRAKALLRPSTPPEAAAAGPPPPPSEPPAATAEEFSLSLSSNDLSPCSSSEAEIAGASTREDEPPPSPEEQQAFEASGEDSTHAPAPPRVSTPAPTAEPMPVGTSEDRELALELLRARASRLHPNLVPVSFAAPSVALVAERLAELPGSPAEKLDAALAALDGAFALSKDRPPSVRFIWGDQEHFLAHVRRGLDAREREARQRAREEARRRVREAAAGDPPPERSSPVCRAQERPHEAPPARPAPQDWIRVAETLGAPPEPPAPTPAPPALAYDADELERRRREQLARLARFAAEASPGAPRSPPSCAPA